jgi:hypothetical protein
VVFERAFLFPYSGGDRVIKTSLRAHHSRSFIQGTAPTSIVGGVTCENVLCNDEKELGQRSAGEEGEVSEEGED